MFGDADEEERVFSLGGIVRLEVVQPRQRGLNVVVEQQRRGGPVGRPPADGDGAAAQIRKEFVLSACGVVPFPAGDGPVGVGALVARRRGFARPPLEPLFFGGGQETGLRPGTIPVPLVVGLGLASELARQDAGKRAERSAAIREEALAAFYPLGIRLHSSLKQTLPHVLNFSVPGVDSEALMVAVKDIAAISNGSACTSQSYQPSHVLKSMNLPDEAISGAVRLSWCHMTPSVDWTNIASRIDSLR